MYLTAFTTFCLWQSVTTDRHQTSHFLPVQTIKTLPWNLHSKTGGQRRFQTSPFSGTRKLWSSVDNFNVAAVMRFKTTT